MLAKRLVVGPLQVNCYLLVDEEAGVCTVVDPGGNPERITAAAAELGVTITQIVATHFHFDHILGLEALMAETGAPLAIHSLDAPLLQDPPAGLRFPGYDIPTGTTVDRKLEDGDTITVGGAHSACEAVVIHTPGHSPGGIALFFESEGLLVSGDTLFRGSIGRSDFPQCDPQALLASLQRLMELPDDTRVLPGHGEETTIGWEKRNNMFIRQPGMWV